jgi:hypothetical protein
VEKAQGYFLGRPTPIDAALRLFEAPDIADVA